MKELKDPSSPLSYHPQGVELKFLTDESVLIEFKNKYNRSRWLLGWVLLSALPLFELFSGKPDYLFRTIGASIFVAIIIWVQIRKVYFQERLWIKSNHLVLEKKAVINSKHMTIERNTISQLVHMIDSDKDEANTNWVLRIEYNNEHSRVFDNATYKECLWLGTLLASWAGVELVKKYI